jgi:hypothetical protein
VSPPSPYSTPWHSRDSIVEGVESRMTWLLSGGFRFNPPLLAVAMAGMERSIWRDLAVRGSHASIAEGVTACYQFAPCGR